MDRTTSSTHESPPLYPSLSSPTAKEADPSSDDHKASPVASSLSTPPNRTTSSTHESPPLYPSLSSPTAKEADPSSDDHKASPVASSLSTPPNKEGTQSHDHKLAPSPSSPPPDDTDSAEKWPGTHIMGQPAAPTSHPDNKKAALWGAGGGESDEAQNYHHPYLQVNPIEKPSNSPMESILHKFNSWGKKAETIGNNIWHNLRTSSSVSEAAWGKMNLTAKAITGGGFEALYKQTFTTFPDEKLKKTFACYLSTSTGPVAGTLYLSNAHAAFCSDRPLSFTAPSGQETWSYYKVMLPLGKIGTINPEITSETPAEKYIQIVTIDGHDFWFMGFVNYDKASRHLSESISSFVASGIAAKPVVE